MLFALFLTAAAVNWVPMRWGSAEPRSLEALRGTPVNCLLLESEQWTPEFLHQAAQRKLARLGVVHPGSGGLEKATKAVALGLDGVVLEGEYPASFSDAIRSSLSGSKLT